MRRYSAAILVAAAFAAGYICRTENRAGAQEAVHMDAIGQRGRVGRFQVSCYGFSVGDHALVGAVMVDTVTGKLWHHDLKKTRGVWEVEVDQKDISGDDRDKSK